LRPTPIQKRKQYRTIYELLFENPRIFAKTISLTLGVNRNATSNRMKEAFEMGIVFKPQLRRRAYFNFLEYVYFLNCKNPHRMFSSYIEDRTIAYHAQMSGFANLLIISNTEIDSKNSVLEGLRSDYHVSFAPDHSWDRTIEIMQEKINLFETKEYIPRNILQTRWDETIKWNSEYEKLFRIFKYDLRQTFTPVRKETLISSGKIYEWLRSLNECCTVFTLYYPKMISNYDNYLFMFETNYEDFVIDLFSELPTSTTFFKVSGRLFAFTHVERQYVRAYDFCKPKELQIPLLIDDLIERGIVKSEEHALIECYWRKEI